MRSSYRQLLQHTHGFKWLDTGTQTNCCRLAGQRLSARENASLAPATQRPSIYNRQHRRPATREQRQSHQAWPRVSLKRDERTREIFCPTKRRQRRTTCKTDGLAGRRRQRRQLKAKKGAIVRTKDRFGWYLITGSDNNTTTSVRQTWRWLRARPLAAPTRNCHPPPQNWCKLGWSAWSRRSPSIDDWQFNVFRVLSISPSPEKPPRWVSSVDRPSLQNKHVPSLTHTVYFKASFSFNSQIFP